MKRIISDDEDEYISYCKRSRKLSIDEGVERLSLDSNAKKVMFSTVVSFINDDSNNKESLTDEDDSMDDPRRHSYTAVDQYPLAYESGSGSSITNISSAKIDTEKDDNKVEIGKSSNVDFSVPAPSHSGMYHILENYSLKDVNGNPTLPAPSRTGKFYITKNYTLKDEGSSSSSTTGPLPAPSRTGMLYLTEKHALVDEGISSCSFSTNNSDSTKVGVGDNNTTSKVGKDNNEETTITSQENHDSNVDTICSMVTAVQVASDDSESMCSRSSLEDIQIIENSETYSGPTIEEIQENTESTTDDEDDNNHQHYNSGASSEREDDAGDYYYEREEIEYDSSDDSFCSVCGKYHD